MRLLASYLVLLTLPTLWAEPRRASSQNARKPSQSPELAGKIEDSKHKHAMDTLEPDPALSIFEVKPRNPIARTTAMPQIKPTGVPKAVVRGRRSTVIKNSESAEVVNRESTVIRSRRATHFIDERGVIHPEFHSVPSEYDLINEDFVQAEIEAQQREEEKKLQNNVLREQNTPPPPPVYTTRVVNDANVENPSAVEESLKVKHVKVPSSLFITDDQDEFEADESGSAVDTTTSVTNAPITTFPTSTTTAPISVTTTTVSTWAPTTVISSTTTTISTTTQVSTTTTFTTTTTVSTTTVPTTVFITTVPTTVVSSSKPDLGNFFDEVSELPSETTDLNTTNLKPVNLEKTVKVSRADIQFSNDDSVEIIGELNDPPARIQRAQVIQSSRSTNPEKQRFVNAKRLILSNFVTRRYTAKELGFGYTRRAKRQSNHVGRIQRDSLLGSDPFSVDKHVQQKLEQSKSPEGYELRRLPGLEPPRVAYYQPPPHLTTSIPGALQGFLWTAPPVLVPISTTTTTMETTTEDDLSLSVEEASHDGTRTFTGHDDGHKVHHATENLRVQVHQGQQRSTTHGLPTTTLKPTTTTIKATTTQKTSVETSTKLLTTTTKSKATTTESTPTELITRESTKKQPEYRPLEFIDMRKPEELLPEAGFKGNVKLNTGHAWYNSKNLRDITLTESDTALSEKHVLVQKNPDEFFKQVDLPDLVDDIPDGEPDVTDRGASVNREELKVLPQLERVTPRSILDSDSGTLEMSGQAAFSQDEKQGQTVDNTKVQRGGQQIATSNGRGNTANLGHNIQPQGTIGQILQPVVRNLQPFQPAPQPQFRPVQPNLNVFVVNGRRVVVPSISYEQHYFGQNFIPQQVFQPSRPFVAPQPTFVPAAPQPNFLQNPVNSVVPQGQPSISSLPTPGVQQPAPGVPVQPAPSVPVQSPQNAFVLNPQPLVQNVPRSGSVVQTDKRWPFETSRLSNIPRQQSATNGPTTASTTQATTTTTQTTTPTTTTTHFVQEQLPDIISTPAPKANSHVHTKDYEVYDEVQDARSRL
ncbi:unnamed protein product [Bursaphelenchus okinawaensis]|uniref:Uncharacterized protein n=1 Tax=Bursaphelenchus okinawaensis TaxID=465554 RepID=A0A811KBN8_9BILA|nr:unnamed protein product [Bursaphelenchus okinawaensis]CAG9099519.1 unnamed protein product [Bursaphelenchus okinawaensis]